VNFVFFFLTLFFFFFLAFSFIHLLFQFFLVFLLLDSFHLVIIWVIDSAYISSLSHEVLVKSVLDLLLWYWYLPFWHKRHIHVLKLVLLSKGRWLLNLNVLILYLLVVLLLLRLFLFVHFSFNFYLLFQISSILFLLKSLLSLLIKPLALCLILWLKLYLWCLWLTKLLTHIKLGCLNWRHKLRLKLSTYRRWLGEHLVPKLVIGLELLECLIILFLKPKVSLIRKTS